LGSEDRLKLQAGSPRSRTNEGEAFMRTLLGFGLVSLILSFAPALSLPAHAIPARFGLAPDNSQELLLSTLRGAKRSLLVNIYEFEHPKIADLLVERIRAGIDTRMLVEGEPVGGLSDESKAILSEIRQAMVEAKNPDNRLFLMTGVQGGKERRFRFNHAKYVVADGEVVLVSSENFSVNGHPDAGKKGNRGWGMAVKDAATAQRFTALFAGDVDLKHGDVKEIPTRPRATGSRRIVAAPPEDRAAPRIAGGKGEVDSVELLTSPDSLKGLTSLIRSARDSIEVEHMSYPSTWLTSDDKRRQSPLVAALLQAARNGVKVRVLLNDEDVFGKPVHEAARDLADSKNEITAKLLMNRARCENLKIAARIVSVEKVGITYIHNKGMIVDGRTVMVSSINGTQNSVMNNREVALVVRGEDAGRYYGSAFAFDWKNSPALPKDDMPCRSEPRALAFSPDGAALHALPIAAEILRTE
jgi:cardiolipin synthase A/B